MAHPPCIVVTGMHRSATSAVAAALQSAGVRMGDRLLVGNAGNLRGYFEDAEFVFLHQDALKALGLSKEGWVTDRRCEFLEPVCARARELIETRRRRGVVWGWKDPRTVLFLEEWGALIPEARFMFVLRAPWEVLDSLYRRNNPGDEVFEAAPDLAVEVYTHYARLMLDFAKRNPQRAMFFEVHDLLTGSLKWIERLRVEWNLPLADPDATVLDPEGAKKVGGEYRQQLLVRYFPNCVAVYRELLAAAGKSAEFDSGETPEKFAGWALQDWVALRRAQGSLTQARETEETLRQQLAAANRERDEWRQRASEWESRYRRFQGWVESSVFWQWRRAILTLASRLGFRVCVESRDRPRDADSDARLQGC